MNLTDLHMFKPEKDKIIATFTVFFFVFFYLPLAASELHPLGTPNDVCTALDTPTKWVSLFLFSLSISSCSIVYPSSPLWWSINVTDFYQSNPQRQHMHWTEGGGDHLTLSGFQTHPWVHSTPFMIYITTGYQRSPSVENVSWAWMSGFFFSSAARMDKGLASARLSRMYWI